MTAGQKGANGGWGTGAEVKAREPGPSLRQQPIIVEGSVARGGGRPEGQATPGEEDKIEWVLWDRREKKGQIEMVAK